MYNCVLCFQSRSVLLELLKTMVTLLFNFQCIAIAIKCRTSKLKQKYVSKLNDIETKE